MKAKLTGNEPDLDALTCLLPSGSVRVVREGGVYYLMADEIDSPPSQMTFYEAALDVLARVNGLARGTDSEYQPVKLVGTFLEGDRWHGVIWPDPLAVRISVGTPTVVTTNSDGAIQPTQQPSNGPQRLAVAATIPAVAEALRIMGEPAALGWVELYKVYEIVREAVRPTKLDQTGLVDPGDLTAFTASANRPDVSGAGARHARMPGLPPRLTMTLDEGRQFVSALVVAWIDSLRPDKT